MAYYDWREFFMGLERWGFSDILLPFLLIFAIVFAIMQKTKILGEKKNYNVIVAFVLAFATVIPHVTGTYPLGYDPILVLQRALPTVSIVLVAVIMLLLLIGIWGVESDWVSGNSIRSWIVIVSVVAIVYIFGASANWWRGWGSLDRIFGSDSIAIVVMILVFAVVIGFITGDEQQSKGDGFMRQLGDMFKKK